MTLNDTANSLFTASVAGYFNGEKFTEKQLVEYIKTMFRCNLKNNRLTMQIALPDGWWYFTISNPHGTPDGYLWYIPETREQEKRIIESLFN